MIANTKAEMARLIWCSRQHVYSLIEQGKVIEVTVHSRKEKPDVVYIARDQMLKLLVSKLEQCHT